MKEQNLQSLCQPEQGGVPVAIGIKVASKEGGGGEFVLVL
jgi:hypothetical protein